MHPVEPVDCLDRKASGAKESDLLPSAIDSVERLVIDAQRIPVDRLLFRIAAFPKVILIRRDLAEALDKTGFTGFRWLELSKYPEI